MSDADEEGPTQEEVDLAGGQEDGSDPPGIMGDDDGGVEGPVSADDLTPVGPPEEGLELQAVGGADSPELEPSVGGAESPELEPSAAVGGAESPVLEPSMAVGGAESPELEPNVEVEATVDADDPMASTGEEQLAESSSTWPAKDGWSPALIQDPSEEPEVFRLGLGKATARRGRLTHEDIAYAELR